MSSLTPPDVLDLPIREDLPSGIDVGGTKIHVADTQSSTVRRYNTCDHQSMDELLDEYFTAIGARPGKIFVGMAGPRNDDTGEIKLTNADWPVFSPDRATAKYGVEFATALDMVTIAAGVLQDGNQLVPLKSGTPTRTGTKLVVTISTGVGTAAAVWDNRSGRHLVIDGLGGHAGFQPKTNDEHEYLRYLLAKNPHASIERALSGKHGIDNLIRHSLQSREAARLSAAIETAQLENHPAGAVLFEFATQDDGADQAAAQHILNMLGAMLGSAIRDWTLTYHATGGVYLTGSVAMALGEYCAVHTEMSRRFEHAGPENDSWLSDVPINLVADPNIGVLGALALAKSM